MKKTVQQKNAVTSSGWNVRDPKDEDGAALEGLRVLVWTEMANLEQETYVEGLDFLLHHDPNQDLTVYQH